MKQKIKNILTNLEETKENLLSLSDDIWLSIDHNDTEAMREGVAFKTEYNAKLAELDRLSAEIAVLLEQFAGVHKEDKEQKRTAETNDRIIKKLNTLEPHSLNESFMYKRPCAFVINGQAFDEKLTWRDLYISFMSYLAKSNPENYKKLATSEEFISKQGNSPFSIDGKDHRVSRNIEGVHVELNCSANGIRDVIRKVLDFMAIDHKNMIIYLREDRDYTE